MKTRKTLSILTIVFLLAGCGVIQLTDTQEVAGSILARRLGHALATNHPATAERLEPIAEALAAGLGEAPMLDTFVSILADNIDDPSASAEASLLQADIKDLASLIKVEGPAITIEEMRSIKTVMAAFLQGIEMGGER